MRPVATMAALLAMALILAGCGGAGLGDGQVAPPPAPDRRAAAAPFDVPALDGDGRVTLAEHRGRPVVLNFWASWCRPCQKETPDLVRFAAAHPGVDVIGLAVNDAPSDSRAFAKRFQIPYELGIDRRGDVGARYDIVGLPVTVAIDGEGRVLSTYSGGISAEDLETFAAQLGPDPH